MEKEIKDIKFLRKRLGITQSDLAKLSGVSQSLITKIESGKIDPTYSKTMQIFSALDNFNKKSMLKAKDILNKKLICVSSSDKIQKVVKIMTQNEISQLPVIDNKNIVGFISESIILKHIFDKKEILIKDIMEESPPIISPNANLDMISYTLLFYPMIVVQEKGNIIGLITKSDILTKKYFSQNKNNK